MSKEEQSSGSIVHAITQFVNERGSDAFARLRESRRDDTAARARTLGSIGLRGGGVRFNYLRPGRVISDLARTALTADQVQQSQASEMPMAAVRPEIPEVSDQQQPGIAEQPAQTLPAEVPQDPDSWV